MAEHIVGLVGSSMKKGLVKASFFTQSIAWSTSHTWLASDHQIAIGADHLAGNGQAADIVFEIAADLHFDMVEAGVDGFLAEAAQLVVVIAEPAAEVV